MNVAQNISAIFNSPEWAEVNLQAVQAGDMAERELAEGLRRDALRRESQVTGTDPSMPFGVVESHGDGAAEPRRPARRGSRKRELKPDPPLVQELAPDLSVHRVDLVA